MKLTKKIILSSIILSVTSVNGGIVVLTKYGERVDTTQENKLELGYSTHENINIITPNTVVLDSGEADNLSNYIVKNLTKGKLEINKHVDLKLCGNNTYILSIGINYSNKLKYAVSDAKIVPLKIERSCKHTETKVLLNEEATKENIIKSIDKISTKIRKKDTFILFYSGFGAKVKDKKVIIPIDAQSEKNSISLNRISKMFLDKKAGVFIFTDTYFQPLNLTLTK